MVTIKCPKCKTEGIEIKTNGYPKQIFDKKYGYEYRFVCPNCGHEWRYDTIEQTVLEVSRSSNLHFSKEGKVIEK